jgi:DNA-binding PadR family transcriptional regulator
MPSSRFPIPQGTLDMLILQILSLEPAHGYGIAQRLEQISRSVVRVNEGSLYPALHRLQQRRLAARRVETVGNCDFNMAWARVISAFNRIQNW